MPVNAFSLANLASHKPEAQHPSKYSSIRLASDHIEKDLRARRTFAPESFPISVSILRFDRIFSSSTTKEGEGTRDRSKRAKAPGPELWVGNIRKQAEFLGCVASRAIRGCSTYP